ncbi:SGNH/GDSL hydrolase family protein [Streptomyces sp. T-3]|nr:SGNH/GDSL hydrolase family protein [Streptomyces sp. T-3]
MTARTSTRLAATAFVAAATLVALSVADASATKGPQHSPRWQGAWAASPQSATAPFAPNWSQEGFSNHTVRQVIRIGQDGTRARIELSNRYGKTPLKITGATVARTDKGASVQPGSVRKLTFGKGSDSVTIPAGGKTLSDGVPFKVKAFESVTVTLYLAQQTGPATFHHLASAKSYRATGDHRADAGADAFKESTESWYYLSGVEVTGGKSFRRDGIVAFGDSITDGVGSTSDANNRYPDELAERLAAAGQQRPVLNQGIGGNQVVNDTTWAGEKALARFQEDVLNEPGVRTVVILEGTNDIGASTVAPPLGGTPDVSVEELIAGHRELIRRAHAKGIKAVGATLIPWGGSNYDDPKGLNEAKRDALNKWIRTSGEYDAVADFDRAVADPADDERILPAYDSGDKLHPNDAGYKAMAEALDLDEL